MPRTGNGTYVLPPGNPVIPSTVIRSDWANSTLGDIAQALTGSISKDGQTSPTANLTMAGYRHLNVADAQNPNEYATARQLQNLSLNRLTTAITSTATAYVATSPLNTQVLTDGMIFIFTPNVDNGLNPTLAVNGLAAAPLLDSSRIPIVPGVIKAGVPYYIRVAGSAWLVAPIQYGALQTTGGTMVGDLILKGDPTSTFMAATKQYVDLATGSGGPPNQITQLDSAAIITDTGTNGKLSVVLDAVEQSSFTTAVYRMLPPVFMGVSGSATLTNSPNAKLLVAASPTLAAPGTSGSVDNAVAKRVAIGTVAFDHGAYSSGVLWTQTRSWGNLATNQNWNINPNGGVVAFNAASIAAWAANATQFGTYAGISELAATNVYLTLNTYWNGSAWTNIGTGFGAHVRLDNGAFVVNIGSASAAAGAATPLTQGLIINATNGNAQFVASLRCRRLLEECLQVLGGATMTCNWQYGGTQLVIDQATTVSFTNIPASSFPSASPICSHFVQVTQFNQVTWPGTVNWGTGGKPSIAGTANVIFTTIDGGTTVQASVIWY